MRFSTLATMFSILFNTSNSFLYTSDYINCMVRNNFIPTDCIDNIYNNRILQEQAIRLGIRKPVNMSFKKSPSSL